MTVLSQISTTEGAGCAGAPGAAATRSSLHPLTSKRVMNAAKLGRIAPRERRVMSSLPKAETTCTLVEGPTTGDEAGVVPRLQQTRLKPRASPPPHHSTTDAAARCGLQPALSVR